jgi:hypothetical protein
MCIWCFLNMYISYAYIKIIWQLYIHKYRCNRGKGFSFRASLKEWIKLFYLYTYTYIYIYTYIYHIHRRNISKDILMYKYIYIYMLVQTWKGVYISSVSKRVNKIILSIYIYIYIYIRIFIIYIEEIYLKTYLCINKYICIYVGSNLEGGVHFERL